MPYVFRKVSGLFKGTQEKDIEQGLFDGPFCLFQDGVEDPGNMGFSSSIFAVSGFSWTR
jgi:hypothetical protein